MGVKGRKSPSRPHRQACNHNQTIPQQAMPEFQVPGPLRAPKARKSHYVACSERSELSSLSMSATKISNNLEIQAKVLGTFATFWQQ